MSTATMTFKPVNKTSKFFLLVLLAIVLTTSVVLNDHAVLRHGTEAQRVRKCLDSKGPYMTFRGMGNRKNDYFFLCKLSDGKFGLQALTCSAGQLIEKTAFIPKDGSKLSAINYLLKFATKFTGEIKCH